MKSSLVELKFDIRLLVFCRFQRFSSVYCSIGNDSDFDRVCKYFSTFVSASVVFAMFPVDGKRKNVVNVEINNKG